MSVRQELFWRVEYHVPGNSGWCTVGEFKDKGDALRVGDTLMKLESTPYYRLVRVAYTHTPGSVEVTLIAAEHHASSKIASYHVR